MKTFCFASLLTNLFHSGSGGYYQHHFPVYSLFQPWVHWNLDFLNDLHKLADVCGYLEVHEKTFINDTYSFR